MNTSLTKELVFELSTKSYGMVPGVIKEIADRSVMVAYLYLSGTQTMEKSSLTELEINAIELRISSLNKCQSCIKGHTFLAKKAGLGDDDVQAIIRNEETGVDRLNRLLRATEYIYYSGSDIYPDLALDFFTNEGLTEQELFEIIGLISLKVISNYVNNYLASVKRKYAKA